jgi:D-aminopeptidase
VTPVGGADLNPFFAAVIDATEESVLNCLLSAETMTGRSGNTSPGLPADAVKELLSTATR